MVKIERYPLTALELSGGFCYTAHYKYFVNVKKQIPIKELSR